MASRLRRRCRAGCPGLRRPLRRDGRSWWLLGLASLSLSGSQVRIAELVQFGCDLGLQSNPGGCSITSDQLGELGLSRLRLFGLTLAAQQPPVSPLPSKNRWERDPIPYALETDWPVGAAGFEPLHSGIEIRQDSQPGGQDSNLRISN